MIVNTANLSASDADFGREDGQQEQSGEAERPLAQGALARHMDDTQRDLPEGKMVALIGDAERDKGCIL